MPFIWLYLDAIPLRKSISFRGKQVVLNKASIASVTLPDPEHEFKWGAPESDPEHELAALGHDSGMETETAESSVTDEFEVSA